MHGATPTPTTYHATGYDLQRVGIVKVDYGSILQYNGATGQSKKIALLLSTRYRASYSTVVGLEHNKRKIKITG